jgi:hypothetical protein
VTLPIASPAEGVPEAWAGEAGRQATSPLTAPGQA